VIEELRTVPNLLENAADELRRAGYDEEAVAAKLAADLMRPWLRRHGFDEIPIWVFRRQYLEIMKALLGEVPPGTKPSMPEPEAQRYGEVIETISEGVEA
jgi:hypothetical protein